MSDTAVLVEIRNLLEYMVRQQYFGRRTVPDEGGVSWDEQERFIEQGINNIKKTGKSY